MTDPREIEVGEGPVEGDNVVEEGTEGELVELSPIDQEQINREARDFARQAELAYIDAATHGKNVGLVVEDDGDGDGEGELEDDAEAEGYEGWTNEELSDELRGRDLPVSGNKDELVARLEADDAALADDPS